MANSFFIVLLASAWLFCTADAPASDTNITTNITIKENTTWSGYTELKGNVIIPEGLTLTLAPQTTLTASSAISTIWLGGNLVIDGRSFGTQVKLMGQITIQSDSHKATFKAKHCHFAGTNIRFSQATYKDISITDSIWTSVRNQPAPSLNISISEDQSFYWKDNILGERVSLNTPNDFSEKIRNTVFAKKSSFSVHLIPNLHQCDLFLIPMNLTEKNKRTNHPSRIWKNIYCHDDDMQKYLKSAYQNIFLSQKPFNKRLISLLDSIQNDDN